MHVVPFAREPNITALCEMDLSPGTDNSPRSGCASWFNVSIKCPFLSWIIFLGDTPPDEVESYMKQTGITDFASAGRRLAHRKLIEKMDDYITNVYKSMGKGVYFDYKKRAWFTSDGQFIRTAPND